MELNALKPRIALNKAFLKVKPNRPEIELFKKNQISLIDNTFESRIDQLVYQLYGLTQEEIGIVEDV